VLGVMEYHIVSGNVQIMSHLSAISFLALCFHPLANNHEWTDYKLCSVTKSKVLL